MKLKTIQLGVIIALLLAVGFADASARKRKSLEDILKNNPDTTAPKTTPKSDKSDDSAKASPDAGKTKQTTPKNKSDIITRKSPRLPSERDDEVVRRILRDKPSVPPAYPKGYDPSAHQKKKLRADRTLEMLRVGKIYHDKKSNWWVIQFDPDKDGKVEPARRLLPNGLLEQVEDQLKKSPDTRFRILGENTTDEENQYLLLRRVVIVDRIEKAPAEEEPGKKGSFENVLPDAGKKDSDPTAPEAKSDDDKKSDDPKGQPSAGDIAKELLKNRPGQALIAKPRPERSAEENKQSVAPVRELPATKAKRQIYSRTVRIHKIKDSDWYEIRFVSDNTLSDPPMKILPNSRLAKALRIMQKGGRAHQKFLLSGEVTIYKNTRYILIRSVIKKRDMNQF